MLRRLRAEERGVVAVWVAVVFLFLLGSTALAVDASELWQVARFERTVADLACLAGARHLPEDPGTARQKAVDFAQANWPAMRILFPVVTESNQVTLDDGEGNRVVITGPYEEPVKMRVQVFREPATRFGRVLGVNEVEVVQTAYCKTLGLRPWDLPFGTLPGDFNGILQRDEPCGEDMGNCHALRVPRYDTNDAGKAFMMNLATGAQKELVVYQGTELHCNDFHVCNVINTYPGVSEGQLSNGLVREFNFPPWTLGRLREPLGSTPLTTPGGRQINNDSFDDVMEWSFSPEPPPPGFDPDVHGNWSDYRYVTAIRDCSSPRIGRIPVVERLEGGMPGEGWPPGDKKMKILGFHWVFVDDPNDPSDFNGPPDGLRRVSGIAFWTAPDVLCAGPNAPTRPFQPGDPKVIRLVDG